MLESFIIRWGYLAIGVGTFLEGETIVLLAGALAHRGLLSLPLVMAAAFVGAVAGDQAWFQVGRRFGPPFVERRPGWTARSAQAKRWLYRYGIFFVLGFRFIYGIRTITPIFLGASGYPMRRFVPLNIMGGAVWASAFAGVGWGIGATLKSVLGRASHVEELIGLAIVVTLVLWAVARRKAASVERRRLGTLPH